MLRQPFQSTIIRRIDGGVVTRASKAFVHKGRISACTIRRHFSDKKNSDAIIQDAAKTLSWMGYKIVNGGGSAEESSSHIAAKELARRLSPEAQRELAKLSNEQQGTTATTATTAAAATVPEPSRHDLRLVALNQAIPFVGFGIMDNAILILAGDAIDYSLGIALGISTLCAAAIGNIVSDVAGVMLGTVIEDYCARLGLPVAQITAAQRQLRSVRFASQYGCAIGIVVGCIIGMFPLLFLDTNKVQKQKREKHMDGIFRDVVTEAKGLIGAEVTSLFLVVDTNTCTSPSSSSSSSSSSPDGQQRQTQQGQKQQYLYAKYVGGTTSRSSLRFPIGHCALSEAALTGETINIDDAAAEPDYKHMTEVLKPVLGDHKLKNMLCVPVLDAGGRVIAVIQAINKIEKGTAASSTAGSLLRRALTIRGHPGGNDKGGFTSADVQVLKALATHVSVALQNMYDEENEVSLRDTIRILKDHGVAAIMDDNKSGTARPLYTDKRAK